MPWVIVVSGILMFSSDKQSIRIQKNNLYPSRPAFKRYLEKRSDREYRRASDCGNCDKKIDRFLIYKGSGCFFYGKMPGCFLPGLAAATALHFTAGYLKSSLQQEPTPCFAFLGGNSFLPF
jgi:hypothetical protein